MQSQFARVIIGRKVPRLMRNPFRAKPKSFLDAPRRDWQFAVYAWLLRNCGGYPKFLETTLVLPIEEHFPANGMRGHAAVAALFRRVRDHAGMADWPCAVEPEAKEPRAALATSERIPVITYRPGELPAMSMVGAFAHELARMLVETFEEQVPGGAPLHDPAIDLAAVFLGFGVFMANSTIEAARYDLNEGEFVHALAIFCLLRKIDPETVARHLNPHLRKYLRLAARDLAQHEPQFHRLRSVFAVVPIDASGRTLPSR
ncbi:MAG TPA: hypothetical protein VFU13_21495 [Steroidobacteraceae bacterium]|nr:hypothetical protein [Steroidobacteraceae bacterium]